MSAKKYPSGLGRGLGSLIPKIESRPPEGLVQLGIQEIYGSSGQPRQHFEPEALEELASSIKKHGILQPIVVRKDPKGSYEIVAGERRWRAAERAGLKTVPCIISEVSDRDLLTLALVENIQREDLNAIEEAESYQRLVLEQGLNQEQVAQAVGKERSTVANALRLLKLPPAIQSQVVLKKITMGHARALVSLEDQSLIHQVVNQITERQLSVRATEALVAEKQRNSSQKKTKKLESGDEKEVRRRLEQVLGTRVELRNHQGSGTLVIHFASIDQFNDLVDQITARKA
ncbi:MAG: ParB/RepB/Spo0J family partition protein [Myxococcaceae bacterium]|nr:ParB/RepB/Spo0J family partition protein [Myxococcaceae bacterium]MBH2005820.1 ParB/RepB/Spo0J family partition protein [Myxococcaceae bacterium]